MREREREREGGRVREKVVPAPRHPRHFLLNPSRERRERETTGYEPVEQK